MSKELGYFFRPKGTEVGRWYLDKMDTTDLEPINTYVVAKYKNGNHDCSCPAAVYGKKIVEEGVPCKHALMLKKWLALPESSRHDMFWNDKKGTFQKRPGAET
jgi:hypothetical protein